MGRVLVIRKKVVEFALSTFVTATVSAICATDWVERCSVFFFPSPIIAGASFK